MNWFIKIISSIPVILVTLFFIPILGICLLLIRFLDGDVKKKRRIVLLFFVLGIIILIPMILDKVLQFLKLKNVNIPFLKEIVEAKIYKLEFIKYGKLLIIISVVILIVSLTLKYLFDKLGIGISKYIKMQEAFENEYKKENDLKMRIKQEKAKRTCFIKCPYCGGDNVITEQIGICQYCRRKIINKNYK